MTVKIDVYMDGGRDYYIATYKNITFVEINILPKDYVMLRLLLRFYFRLRDTIPTAMTSKGLRIAYLDRKGKMQLKIALKRIYKSSLAHIEARSVKDMSKLTDNDLDSILYKIIDLESYLILITCS